jgi:hypothetical protein
MQYLPAVINKPISPFHSVEVVDYIKAKDTYTFVRRVQPSVYIEHYAGEIININIAWVDLRPVVLLNILL